MMRVQPRSVPEMLACLPQGERSMLIDMVSRKAVAEGLWDMNSGGATRRAQRYPPDPHWRNWLMLLGRGGGKTFVLTNAARTWAYSGQYPVVGMVGATSDDTRRVLIEGDSGVMATSPRWQRPTFKKNDRMLEWPNGARTYLFSAEDPDRFRGANLYGLLADELAAWKNPRATWDQAKLTLRRGRNPRTIIATTPRPSLIVRELASDPTTFLSVGSTYDNFENLAEQFIEEVVKLYEGTRLGQQELQGKILIDTPNSVFRQEDIAYAPDADLRALRRVVVAVDPSGTTTGDECGIVVVGEFEKSARPRFLVLEDCSVQGSPNAWASAAARAFDRWKADVVVAEVNFGGDMVLSVMKQNAPSLPIRKIHASRGKIIRAQPVGHAYERHEVAHLAPFEHLERQMCQMSETEGYTGKGSPDRADALCHAIAYLQGVRQPPVNAGAVAVQNSGPKPPIT